MTVSVPNESILRGPCVTRKSDGPMLSWASYVHFLTWRERLQLALRRTTIEQLAEQYWPGLVIHRRRLLEEQKP